MIYGNIEGIRESQLNELERLYGMEFARDEFLPDRLLALLVRFTQALNREIMVYLGRDGSVLEIAVGSASNVGLPELHLRRNTERLAGFRCIHTHPGGTRAFPSWTSRRCGYCGSTRCAPSAWANSIARALPRPFWVKLSMDGFPS